MLHEIKVGESLTDNKYEFLPSEVQAAYRPSDYVGAQYSPEIAVLMVKVASGEYHRWQRFGENWVQT